VLGPASALETPETPANTAGLLLHSQEANDTPTRQAGTLPEVVRIGTCGSELQGMEQNTYHLPTELQASSTPLHYPRYSTLRSPTVFKFWVSIKLDSILL